MLNACLMTFRATRRACFTVFKCTLKRKQITLLVLRLPNFGYGWIVKKAVSSRTRRLYSLSLPDLGCKTYRLEPSTDSVADRRNLLQLLTNFVRLQNQRYRLFVYSRRPR